MTSTVLDVTVMLLCVSASVVALGGAEDVGGEVNVQDPTADEVADRLATETVTVRYRAPDAANDSRTVHATRAELIALLVADGGRSVGADAAESRSGADGTPFELRARNAVVAGIDERTRIDATIPTGARRERTTARSTVEKRVTEYRGGRRAAGPIATSGTANTPRPLRRKNRMSDGDSQQSGAGGHQVTGEMETVAIGAKPPRSADITTVVLTHPAPDRIGTSRPVRIVVRRW